MISIMLTKPTATIVIHDDNRKATILKGSFIRPTQPTLNAKAKALRDDPATCKPVTDGYEVQCDIVFNSLSGVASFYAGSEKSGNAFFKKYLEGTPTEAKAEGPTEAKPTEKAEIPSKKEDAKPDLKAMQEANNELAKKVMTFCKDFEYKPDPRCLNTLKYISKPSEHLVNSMELMGYDPALVNMAIAKFKSAEWKEIEREIKAIPTTRSQINQRLEIFYGPAGTGKTTEAQRLYPEAVTIVASATADPDDLFTKHEPNGKGGVDLVLTEIGEAMRDGKAIIIDEANLYGEAILARLQGITDAKGSIFDRGMRIDIAEGFRIVITMNLETNFGKTPLPSPLVSRAMRIEKYDEPYLGWVW